MEIITLFNFYDPFGSQKNHDLTGSADTCQWINDYLAETRSLIKTSLSVQCSVAESFKFNGKHMRSVYVREVGQCLVSKDVYEAIGYDKENGVKAIQRLVPEKYKIQFGDTQVDLEECVDNSFHTQLNTMLLKEPGLYYFLLRCKKDEAEPFTEWVVETVLPREVRQLT